MDRDDRKQDIGISLPTEPATQVDSFNGKTLVSKTSFVGSTPALPAITFNSLHYDYRSNYRRCMAGR